MYIVTFISYSPKDRYTYPYYTYVPQNVSEVVSGSDVWFQSLCSWLYYATLLQVVCLALKY